MQLFQNLQTKFINPKENTKYGTCIPPRLKIGSGEFPHRDRDVKSSEELNGLLFRSISKKN